MKRHIVPNITIGTLFIFLLLFGFFENRLNIYSFAIAIAVLIFFIILILLKPNMVLGGGDIKYMMVVAFFLEPLLFPLFLVVTGILQALFIIYFQKIKNKKESPMIPAMFLAVIICQVSFFTNIYPF